MNEWWIAEGTPDSKHRTGVNESAQFVLEEEVLPSVNTIVYKLLKVLSQIMPPTKTVLIALDGSKHSTKAFNCE